MAYDVTTYGADPTCVLDAAPAICEAIMAAGPSGHVVVPQGSYRLKSGIDFAALFPGANLYKFRFECLGGVEFFQDTSFTSGQLFNLSAPDPWQILNCQFLFGTITGVNSAANPVVAIRLRYCNDSTLKIDRVNYFLGNAAVLVDCSGTPTAGCFNNHIHIGTLNTCKQGFVTNGSSGEFGFQCNTVFIDHAIGSTSDQIVLDENGVGLNSKNNTFICGAIEHGSGAGIIDHAGQNLWIIADTNNNANGGFLNASTVNSPLVIGTLEEVVSAGTIGNALYPRWMSAQDLNAHGRGWSVGTPGVPTGVGTSHTVTNANPFSVRVVHRGGVGMHIVQPGGTLGNSGDMPLVADPTEFVLDPGARVYFGSVAPSAWNWYGQII